MCSSSQAEISMEAGTYLTHCYFSDILHNGSDLSDAQNSVLNDWVQELCGCLILGHNKVA